MTSRTRWSLLLVLGLGLPFTPLGTVQGGPARAEPQKPGKKKPKTPGQVFNLEKTFAYFPIPSAGGTLVIQTRKSQNGTIRIYHQFVATTNKTLLDIGKVIWEAEDPKAKGWGFLDVTEKSPKKSLWYNGFTNKFSKKQFTFNYAYQANPNGAYARVVVTPKPGNTKLLEENIAVPEGRAVRRNSADAEQGGLVALVPRR
jgi:hypothetical protein